MYSSYNVYFSISIKKATFYVTKRGLHRWVKVCKKAIHFLNFVSLQAILLPWPVVLLLRVLSKKQVQPGLRLPELHPRVLPIRLLHVTDRRKRSQARVQRKLCTPRNQMQRLPLRSPLCGRNHFHCKLLGVRLFTINLPCGNLCINLSFLLWWRIWIKRQHTKKLQSFRWIVSDVYGEYAVQYPQKILFYFGFHKVLQIRDS